MSDNSKSQDKAKKAGTSKGLVIVCIVAVVIIAVLIGIIVVMMNSSKSNENVTVEDSGENEKRPVLLTEDNIDDMADEILNQSEPEGVPMSYQVTMNSTWEFEDGETASRNAYVANSENNETPVYFDVIRNDTQEVIYQSPVIPLGMDLEDIVLDVDLDAGNYECTLVYHLLDEDQNTLTTVNMWLMVKVEN
ncbi:MAG: hypothetical protein J1F18_04960 [Lachnospiraceae bacterium]|nr:hypothetical protein [Lachnospiraceae bacterium]